MCHRSLDPCGDILVNHQLEDCVDLVACMTAEIGATAELVSMSYIEPVDHFGAPEDNSKSTIVLAISGNAYVEVLRDVKMAQ